LIASLVNPHDVFVYPEADLVEYLDKASIIGQSMAKFDYSAYYRRLQDLKKLQIPAESVCWTEQYRPPDRTYDVVLYLGCNISSARPTWPRML